MEQHALIIYNPIAGAAINPDIWLGTLVHKLCEHYAVTVLPTSPNMSYGDLFHVISDPIDLIVAAGGDGTVRYALGAVAQRGSNVPVGIMPLGTGNQLARNLSIYQENILSDPLEDALAVLLHGVGMPIDLGIMNGEYFCVAAGCGPLSDAIVSPDHREKGHWKMLAYASSMIQTFAVPPVIFRITITGVEQFNVAASGVFITNIADLGVGKLSESAEINDGLLDLCILNPSEFGDYIELGFRFAGGFVGGKAPYYIRKVNALNIEVVPVRSRLSRLQHLGHKIRSFLQGSPTERPPIKREVTAMIDGDACGTTPMHISVAKQSVRVLTPKWIASVTKPAIRSGESFDLDSDDPEH